MSINDVLQESSFAEIVAKFNSGVALVEGIYDDFDDRYLGSKTSDPATDNDGNALVTGALYFNTTDGVMKQYNGTSWKKLSWKAEEWAENPEDTEVETGQYSALHHAAKAEDFKDTALGAANFKGDWSDLTGSLNVPATVRHNSTIWLLINNLADVTTSEPSEGSADWEALSITRLTDSLTANVGSISSLVALPVWDGRKADATAFYADTPWGFKVQFVYDASKSKSDHDGWSVINPDHLSTIGSANWYSSTGDATDDTGMGCWVRDHESAVNLLEVGAKPDGDDVSPTDNSHVIEACDATDVTTSILPDGKVIGSEVISLTNPLSFAGKGTLKWITPSTSNFITMADASDVTFDGIKVDMNNVGGTNTGRFLYINGSNTENLTIENCFFTGCIYTQLIENDDGQTPFINYKVINNHFNAGTDTRHNSHFAATPRNIRSMTFTDNYFYNLAPISTNVSSGYNSASFDEDLGDIIISRNICRGFYPNTVAETPQQSMMLIRSTSSSGTTVIKRIVISDNIIYGGKKGISFGENTHQNFDNVIISNNECINNIIGGISVGRSNDNCFFKNVSVEGNTIYWDISYLDTESPGATDAPRYGISLEGSNIKCSDNTVENYPHSGINSLGAKNVISNNVIKNCGYSETAIDAVFGIGGGIVIIDAEGETAGEAGNLHIHGNTIYGGGFSAADTEKAAGIVLNNVADIKESTIENNEIINTDDKLAIAINLHRNSTPVVMTDLVVKNNTLRGFESKGTIVARRNNDENNQHYISNNYGWGEIETTWNPGTVADGATVTLALVSKECIVGDIVHVYFDGISQESVGNPSQWRLIGYVTSETLYWSGSDGEITVELTNNTGASQTFTAAQNLKVWIERRNKA